jgi:hypothetical protein
MVDHYLPKLQAALEVLTKERLWRKEQSNMNSIGSIVLHIVEHLSRYITKLTKPGFAYPQGIEEHFPNICFLSKWHQ